MSKIKSAFFCSNCGYESAKWIGKCPSCAEWNTFSEEIIDKGISKEQNWDSYHEQKRNSKIIALDEVKTSEEKRIISKDPELNRVLGGGIVMGSIVLVAGEPGIGKSTLFLQNGLQATDQVVLYISGEESEQQIKMRADRLKMPNNNFYLLTETNTTTIFAEIKKLKPTLVIVDSIQTLQSNLIDSAAGSVSQIRECAAEFQKFAKQTNTPVFLIGHITKDGAIAGPKVLEHMVDTVLQFEGDRNHVYRILRSLKNRFGSTAEIGIYEMLGNGLREVSNPSEILISHKDEELSGTAIASTLEGMRPLMIEIQSLVSTAVYGTPQRSTTGYNAKRLNMILAVLEKRAGFRLGAKDVFLNITGGISVDDPAIDLAVVAAILSSNEDIPVNKDFCFAGEVGLSGEIRPVNRVDQRIQEAEKLGFATIFVSKYNKITLKNTGIHIRLVAKIEDVASELFG
jgi:DNA repair protein RadA/Sms